MVTLVVAGNGANHQLSEVQQVLQRCLHMESVAGRRKERYECTLGCVANCLVFLTVCSETDSIKHVASTR